MSSLFNDVYLPASDQQHVVDLWGWIAYFTHFKYVITGTLIDPRP
jgi:hypothetical protein